MLNCELCMDFTWKTFRARFLRQFLWVGAAKSKPADKDPGPSPLQCIFFCNSKDYSKGRRFSTVSGIDV